MGFCILTKILVLYSQPASQLASQPLRNAEVIKKERGRERDEGLKRENERMGVI